jgi:Cytochrome P450
MVRRSPRLWPPTSRFLPVKEYRRKKTSRTSKVLLPQLMPVCRITTASCPNLISIEQEAWRLFVRIITPLPSTSQRIFTYYGIQTWSTIMIFILTMTLFPDKQRRAQEEIDTVIGPSQLPEFSDRESLPYVECLMQEVLRYASEHCSLIELTVLFQMVSCCFPW